MYFVVSRRIFVLPYQRFKLKRWTISAALFAAGSSEVVRIQRWFNLKMIRAALMRAFLT